MHDPDEFLGGGRRLVLARGIDNLTTDMILDHLGNEAVHRPAARRGLVQQLGTGSILFDNGPLQCVNLSTNATKSRNQLSLFDVRKKFFTVRISFFSCAHTPEGIAAPLA